MALQELNNVAQDEPGTRRRWFSDAEFDLIVWQDEDGLRSFQVAYDKSRTEKLLLWRRGGGLSHHRVDRADERPARYARSGFLVEAPLESGSAVVASFLAAAAHLEAPLLTELRRVLSPS